MFNSETINLITAFVAIYGAVLSTFLFIREMIRDKRTIKIFCRETVEDSDKLEDTSPLSDLISRYSAISITAVNSGHRPVVITRVGFKLTFGASVNYSSEAKLPQKLEDGESFAVAIPIAKLRNMIANNGSVGKVFIVSAYVEDTEGKMYTTSLLPAVLKEKGLFKPSKRK